jgi:hypothetical protein
MAFCPGSWPLGPGSRPRLLEMAKEWRLNGKEKKKEKKEERKKREEIFRKLLNKF